MFNLSSTRAVKAFVFRGGKLRDFKSLWWVINVFLKILRGGKYPFFPHPWTSMFMALLSQINKPATRDKISQIHFWGINKTLVDLYYAYIFIFCLKSLTNSFRFDRLGDI